jgi:hypothetical protein
MQEEAIAAGNTGAPDKNDGAQAPLTVAEVKQLLDKAWRTKYAAYFILLHWIDLSRVLNVDRGILDHSSCRHVELNECVVKMLLALRAHGRLNAKADELLRTVIGKVLKTAAADYCAASGDLDQTSRWAGVSAPVTKHYARGINAEDSRAFWNLLPTPVTDPY